MSVMDLSTRLQARTTMNGSGQWGDGGWGGGWGSSGPWDATLSSVSTISESMVNSSLFPEKSNPPGIVSRVATVVQPTHRSRGTPLLLSMTSDSRSKGFFFDALVPWMSDAGRRQRELHRTLRSSQKACAHATVTSIFVDFIIDSTLYEQRSISSVPAEIWKTIFTMAYGDRYSPWSPESALYVPMSVCRLWRDIITGEAAGELWNPIDFRGATATQRRARAIQSGYALQSGSLDLSFSMDGVDSSLTSVLHRLVSPQKRSVLHRLVSPTKHIHLALRISDFYSMTDNASLARSVFRIQNPIPNIDALTIEGGTFWTGDYPCREVLPQWAESLIADQCRLSWACPAEFRLKSLTLMWTLTPETWFDLPWAQLESYAELNTARLHGVLPATHLSRMTNLRVLCLSGVWLPSASLRVTLPCLEELNLVVSWQNVPNDGHFAGLEAPHLRVLSLRGRNARSPQEDQAASSFHHDLEAFLVRCPDLSVLSLALQIAYTGATIVQHMRALPALQSLFVPAANRDLLNLDFVRGMADLSLTPMLRVLGIQQGRYWDELAEESVEESEITAGLLHALARRFETGLKAVSFTENGGQSLMRAHTALSPWEAAAGWDWVDDRWGVGGVMISKALRKGLKRLAVSSGAMIELDH
ncbi:hypothetical protein R3P38DRAFT_2805795 [Favolaschia claudopus]|uniref:F-box domain-containing protein n=1 Tax=Favolaschia claudopus TaxID=2862362 RepID=A0AAV9ZN48_9AGAR